MLMSRPQYTTSISNNNNHHNNIISLNPSMEVSAIPMEQQQQQQPHINQLLSTAAAGTGIVGDVDALLTPLQQLAAAQQLLEPRPERNLWRTDEIMQMLKLMQKSNAIEKLNDKTIKSENVFRTVEEMMNDIGYCKKSHVQIWTKWKFLKSTYTTSKRNSIVPKMIPYEIYEMLHKMLSGNSSDCGNSTTASMDGDNSNGGRMVITGVEGGYSNGNKNGGGADSEDESGGFGMAHPIFGFRLGIVKQEPADTGYEQNPTNGNASDPLDEINTNSQASSTANIRFQTEIKQEIDEETFNTTMEQQQQQQQQQQEQQQQHSEILFKKRPVRITAIPATTTTPTTPSSQTPMITRNPQLPPLRIAPFAKVSSSATNAVVQPTTLNRPPPPLSMHPGTPRPVRITSASGGVSGTNMNMNSTNNKWILPKILPKPATATAPSPSNQQINMPIRLPKDISVQQTRAANANMPRLKQIPARKTPYSLRPDRMIPDLSGSITPPPQPPPPIMPKQYAAPVYQQDGPTTSQRAYGIPSRLQTQMMDGFRKRRLEIPPMPSRGKMPCNISRQMPPPPKANYYNGGEMDEDHGDVNEELDDESSMFDCASAQRASFNASTQQQYIPTSSIKTPPKSNRKEQEFFESALKDLGTSLRQMQREMISEFFEKQMELARREHEFQMKQDLMIMQAFEEQTQQIMRSAKQLLGMDSRRGDAGKQSKNITNQKIKPIRKAVTKAKDESKESTEALLKNPKENAHKLVTESVTAETMEEADETEVQDQEATEEDEDEDNEEESEEENENEQLEYEDGEYLQDNNTEPVIQQMENEDDSDDDDDNENDEENANEMNNNEQVVEREEETADNEDDQNDQDDDTEDDDDEDEDDDVADPIQLVTSELVEDN